MKLELKFWLDQAYLPWVSKDGGNNEIELRLWSKIRCFLWNSKSYFWDWSEIEYCLLEFWMKFEITDRLSIASLGLGCILKFKWDYHIFMSQRKFKIKVGLSVAFSSTKWSLKWMKHWVLPTQASRKWTSWLDVWTKICEIRY